MVTQSSMHKQLDYCNISLYSFLDWMLCFMPNEQSQNATNKNTYITHHYIYFYIKPTFIISLAQFL